MALACLKGLPSIYCAITVHDQVRPRERHESRTLQRRKSFNDVVSTCELRHQCVFLRQRLS